jgi:hypothetical protein
MEYNKQPWPVLNYNDLKETLQCVHLWTQIVGKIRLKQMPWLNHSWHVTLYVSARGLTTGSVPFARGIFQIDLDFVGHEIVIRSSNGGEESVGLYSRSVSDLYEEMFKKLHRMGIDVHIATKPNEVVPAIPFPKDIIIRQYDPVQIKLFWQALVNIEVVFTRFRSAFTGKVSPVQFFWGSFDLAASLMSLSNRYHDLPITHRCHRCYSLRQLAESKGFEDSRPDLPGSQEFGNLLLISAAGIYAETDARHALCFCLLIDLPLKFGLQAYDPSPFLYRIE